MALGCLICAPTAQEAYDISMKHPALAARMKALLDAKNAEMEKTARLENVKSQQGVIASGNL